MSRRVRELTRLNTDFQNMVDMSVKMETIYQCLVKKENYRMLSKFQYNTDETPLRSARVAVAPPMTDVIISLFFNDVRMKLKIIFLLRLYRPKLTFPRTVYAQGLLRNLLQLLHRCFLLGELLHQ